MHPSPFRQMAAQCGATPRELLRKCMELQTKGALAPILPRWGAALRRERWRLGFQAAHQGSAWAQALSQLPGCVRIEQAQGPSEWVWAEVEARNEAHWQQQLARLPAAPAVQLRVSGDGASDAAPSIDIPLASLLEAGLPLTLNPFVHCAKLLERTERYVLSRLSAWQQAGVLDSLSMAPAPTRQPQTGVLAHWRTVDLSAATQASLRAMPGLAHCLVTRPSSQWPWTLSLLMHATPALAKQQLAERLAAAGLHAAPDACDLVRIETPRSAALLFTDQGPG